MLRLISLRQFSLLQPKPEPRHSQLRRFFSRRHVLIRHSAFKLAAVGTIQWQDNLLQPTVADCLCVWISLYLSQNRDQWRALVNNNGPSGCRQLDNFLGLRASGMWCRVMWLMFINVSDELAAIISRREEMVFLDSDSRTTLICGIKHRIIEGEQACS